MNKLYNSGPEGYCGDEDNGQTSAWYVFTALGFYPVCPVHPNMFWAARYFRRLLFYCPERKHLRLMLKVYQILIVIFVRLN